MVNVEDTDEVGSLRIVFHEARHARHLLEPSRVFGRFRQQQLHHGGRQRLKDREDTCQRVRPVNCSQSSTYDASLAEHLEEQFILFGGQQLRPLVVELLVGPACRRWWWCAGRHHRLITAQRQERTRLA